MQPPGGRGATLRPTVLEADPGRQLRWLGQLLLPGLFDGDHSFTVVFALMLRSEEAARRLGVLAGRVASRVLRLLRRPPVAGWELATVKFRSRTLKLVEHRWIAITVTSLVSHLSLYLVLLVALRDVGVSNAEVNFAEVLAVFAFARLATAIPFTPGGVGVVEAVLIGGLVAAVLVYRALTWLLPVPIGVGTSPWWRRRAWTAPSKPAPSPVSVEAS